MSAPVFPHPIKSVPTFIHGIITVGIRVRWADVVLIIQVVLDPRLYPVRHYVDRCSICATWVNWPFTITWFATAEP